MKILRCADLGFDCDYEIRAQSEEDVLHEAAEHVHQEHGVEVTAELTGRVQRHLQDQKEGDSM